MVSYEQAYSEKHLVCYGNIVLGEKQKIKSDPVIQIKKGNYSVIEESIMNHFTYTKKHSEISQTSKMKLYVKYVWENSFQPL